MQADSRLDEIWQGKKNLFRWFCAGILYCSGACKLYWAAHSRIRDCSEKNHCYSLLCYHLFHLIFNIHHYYCYYFHHLYFHSGLCAPCCNYSVFHHRQLFNWTFYIFIYFLFTIYFFWKYFFLLYYFFKSKKKKKKKKKKYFFIPTS